MCSFHTVFSSLPSSSQQRCHFLTEMGACFLQASMNWLGQDILLHLRLLMSALFSSSTHPHAVLHQDVLSFSHSLTHYNHVLPNTTLQPPHAAHNGIQTLSYRPRRPQHGHRSAGHPNVPRGFISISFHHKHSSTDTDPSKPASPESAPTSALTTR